MSIPATTCFNTVDARDMNLKLNLVVRKTHLQDLTITLLVATLWYLADIMKSQLYFIWMKIHSLQDLLFLRHSTNVSFRSPFYPLVQLVRLKLKCAAIEIILAQRTKQKNVKENFT